MGDRSFHSTEAPYSLANDAPEWDRLDAMHNGINDYLGKRLSFAQIGTSPKRILEIGSGSGAWAIQAAQTYPGAEVLAIDISPLPPRPIPDNLKFQTVNVAESLPFEPESFDVVHIRFLFLHLPNFRKVLVRIIDLLKPNGWILVDEIDHNIVGNPGPGIKKFYDVFHGYMALHDVDPTVGRAIKPILEESGKFSEIHVNMVSPKFAGGNGDSTMDHLGEVIKTSLLRASQSLNQKIAAYGMTDEIKEGFGQEITDPESHIHVDLYFTWARKL